MTYANHMKNLLFAILLVSSLTAFSQVRMYTGFLGNNPIQLVTYTYSDGDTRAIYAYDNNDTPIVINGRNYGDSLVLIEYCDSGKATLLFPQYETNHDNLTGTWISSDSKTQRDITATKTNEFDYYDSTSFDTLELMQPSSMKNEYFKLLIGKVEDQEMKVIGVRIYQKKTDKLLQELSLNDCQFWGLENILVDDYNFDGIDDFSVFESSYAGPNTSRIYILRDKKTGNFFVSEISGTSLEFDKNEKRIYEHNQCCAGRSHMYATYKLVKNKMVLIKQSCLEYDDETEDFKETKCE